MDLELVVKLAELLESSSLSDLAKIAIFVYLIANARSLSRYLRSKVYDRRKKQPVSLSDDDHRKYLILILQDDIRRIVNAYEEDTNLINSDEMIQLLQKTSEHMTLFYLSEEQKELISNAKAEKK